MFISFLLLMLLATLIMFTITRTEVEKIGRHHYQQRADFFAAHPPQPGDIVFLGDSLTAGGNWDELFPGLPIKNRGINADTTLGVLARMDPVTQGKPAAVFILIGTNDLPWYVHRHDEMILGTYHEILEKIQSGSPETKIYVESILPRARLYARRVRLLNTQLQQLAESLGVTYIDLHSHFADANGCLRSDLNNDHLHLLAAGYEIWKDVLTPYLEKFK